MYTIVDGIATMNSQFDILVIGQQGVGKTTLLRKYVMGTFDEPNFESSECLVYKSVELPCNCGGYSGSGNPESTANRQISILDSSAGVETLLTQNSYQVKNAQTMVFAYSAASSESFEAMEFTINCIESVRDRLPPCVIVSLKPCHGFMDQVSISQGQELARSCGALAFVEAYLYDDSSVESVFDPLVQVVLDRAEHEECLKKSAAISNPTRGSSLGHTEESEPQENANITSLPRRSSTLPSCSTTTVNDQTDSSVRQDSLEKGDDYPCTSKSEKIAMRSIHRSRSSSNSKTGKAKSGCCIIM